MRKLIFTCMVMLYASFFTNLFAQNNAKLSIQGVLRNSNGTAVENGKYDITFRLWDAATGGNQEWIEEKIDVDVEGGIYSVVLGDGATPLNASFSKQYYLGVAVEGGTELIPRAPLTSSPYALSLQGEDNVFPSSGNVGVGISADTAIYTLTVQDGNGIIGIEPGKTANFTAKIQTSAEGLEFNVPTDKDIILKNEASEHMRIKNGNVGIGTDNPLRKLHIKSNHETMRLEGEATSFLSFYKQSPTDRSGYIGYVYSDNSIMRINNEDGGTELISDYIRLKPTTKTYNHGGMEIVQGGGSLSLVGGDHVYMNFYPGGYNTPRRGWLGFGGAGDHNLVLHHEGSTGDLKLISQSGNVIIDPISSSKTIELKGHVDISASKNISITGYSFLKSGDVGYQSGTTNVAYGLKVKDRVLAVEFHADSDQRIKKDLERSNGKEDLSTLSKIEVTNYRHIDKVAHGAQVKKGLIAQQVASVFPEAINIRSEYIPNIYDFPTSFSSENNEVTIHLSKAHDLKIGDEIKVISERGEEFLTVANVLNNKSFSIKDWNDENNADNLFIYGKKIDDFHAVDYDRVFTLAVSATQELARKVEALEKENAQLKSNATQTNNIFEKLSAKVDALEQTLEMTGQK